MSLDPWQPLLLLVVPGGPPVRYVCPCWCISGGRWQSCGDQAGSRSQLGVDSFVFSVGFLAFALPLCWRIILLQFSFEEDGDHGGVLGEGAVRSGVGNRGSSSPLAPTGDGRCSFIVQDASWQWEFNGIEFCGLAFPAGEGGGSGFVGSSVWRRRWPERKKEVREVPQGSICNFLFS